MTNQEINEAVARKLGKYPSEEAIAWAKSQLTGAGTFKITIADYAGSIQAAWEIVEHAPIFSLTHFGEGQWHCELDLSAKGLALADTAPLAICLAFLKLP